jgi:hypothetical protein
MPGMRASTGGLNSGDEAWSGDVLSNVTNVMVLAFGEALAMSPVVESDEERVWNGRFNNVTTGAANQLWIVNGKGPECDVWVAALNHLRRLALLQDLSSLSWETPHMTQVLIRGQDDDCWGLWMIQAGVLVEIALPGCFRWPRIDAHDEDVGMLRRLTPLRDDQRPSSVSVALVRDEWHMLIEDGDACRVERVTLRCRDRWRVRSGLEPDAVLASVERQLARTTDQPFTTEWQFRPIIKSWVTQLRYHAGA